MRKLCFEECGATLLEGAIVMLLFFTTMFGIVESARLILTYLTLGDAVRAGERYAIVHGNNRTGSGANGASCQFNQTTCPQGTSQVTSVVQNEATAAGLSTVNVTTTYGNAGSNAVGSTVQVTGSYSYTPILGFFPFFQLTLSSTARGMICY